MEFALSEANLVYFYIENLALFWTQMDTDYQDS